MEASHFLLPFIIVLLVTFIASVVLATRSNHFHSAFAVLCVACFAAVKIGSPAHAAGLIVVIVLFGIFCGSLLKISFEK